MQNFPEVAGTLRRRVDESLGDVLQYGPGCPERLRAAMEHSLLAPGKRLRPLLVLMSARACGCEYQRAMPAACAVELVHAYSLIHDDLPSMDDDDIRRGRPSCHAAFDEATAILAGDALLARAFEVLADQVEPPEVAARCCQELAHAAGATALVGGQMDDLSIDHAATDVELAESIHARKTGALFLTSVRLGGLVAGAEPDKMQIVSEYGSRIGLAFQIVDDLLDARGDESVVGKAVGKDAQQGKLTFPGLMGMDASARRAERLIGLACSELEPLGAAAAGLESLARFVLERNH